MLYCGGLVVYFLDVGGSVSDIKALGLGPTVLGLGVVGLLFCFPLALKIVRLVAGLHPPGSRRYDSSPRDNGVDADAMIARYMANRTADTPRSAPRATHKSNSDSPPTFGRRGR